jgi:hypothetical protein
VNKKDQIDQARANMFKTIRSAIRLKYSIMADEELNETLDRAEKAFNAAVLQGELPDPLDVKAALEA